MSQLEKGLGGNYFQDNYAKKNCFEKRHVLNQMQTNTVSDLPLFSVEPPSWKM